MTTPDRAQQAWPRGAWLRIFGGGLVLWLLAVIVTFATANANLVPTIILFGSFLVPVTFVVYAFERRASARLTEHRIFIGFVYGGVLGVLGATLLEAAFLDRPTLLSFLGVGLVEEACKLGALWLVARGLARFAMADGIVLGAAVGFGFAAFESAGYAFNALFTLEGLSLAALVETEVLRGVLTPVGHGLWTAIAGGALFAASRGGRLRVTWAVVGWYLVVSLLHAFWDASGGIATILVLLLTVTDTQVAVVQMGRMVEPTALQVHLFTALNWGLLALDSALGILLLVGRWRRARRVDAAETEGERVGDEAPAGAETATPPPSAWTPPDGQSR